VWGGYFDFCNNSRFWVFKKKIQNQRAAGPRYLKKFTIKEPPGFYVFGPQKNKRQKTGASYPQRTSGFHERTDKHRAIF
jgi:hypothetical protein